MNHNSVCHFSSVEALKLAKDSLKCKVEIILDEAVKKGIDNFKAIVFGTKAVIVGRQILLDCFVGIEE